MLMDRKTEEEQADIKTDMQYANIRINRQLDRQSDRLINRLDGQTKNFVLSAELIKSIYRL